AIAEASEAVFVLDDDQATSLIFEERQELRTPIMHTRLDFFDYLGHLIAPRGAVGGKSLRLAIQFALVLRRRHPCVDRRVLRQRSCQSRLAVGNDDGAWPNPPTLYLAVTEPPPGGFVSYTHLPGVVRTFPVSIVADRHHSCHEK